MRLRSAIELSFVVSRKQSFGSVGMMAGSFLVTDSDVLNALESCRQDASAV
jgi:hypothetical protein